jgi:hypothetical protein
VNDDPPATGAVGALKSPAELALEIYNILQPHTSDVRVRAIQSAMTSLGETAVPQLSNIPRAIGGSADHDFGDLRLGPKAVKWAQKHGITRTMFEEVFHLTDSQVEIIASSVPGTSRREMTINCYLLSGLRGLLKDDASSFDDSDAIEVCKRMAAYDKNNHTANRQLVGNRMSGTRPKFTLTGPGEAAAAELVKQMTATRDH